MYGFLRRFRPGAGLPPYVMMLHGIEERRIHAMGREAKKGRAWYFRWKNRMWERIYHMPLYRWSIQTADQSVVINRETWTMLQLKYNREIGKSLVRSQRSREPLLYSKRIFRRETRCGFSSSEPGWITRASTISATASRNSRNAFPQVRLTIAGCSANAETVRQFFPASVRDQLDILPFIPRKEMPSLYARHDIFVFPSLFEGMPIVLLEAMATGMPVVTTETCGMKDVVENEYNGLLVKPADTAAFVAATERLIHSR